jgi:dolichyl-phosphate beta-glucosyltransferase
LEKTLIIVPCFNEGNRLDLSQFKEYVNEDVIFFFVDDGSSDNTADILLSFIKLRPQHLFLSLKKNKGKGNAIWESVDYLRMNKLISKFEWIGYFDSDLSTPLWEIRNFFTFRFNNCPKAVALFGSRICRTDANIVRGPVRHAMSRFFSILLIFLFDIKISDTQCGAKFFHQSIIDKVFKKKFKSNWIFDVEIVLRLKGESIIEYPLMEWIEKKGSKIKFFTHTVEVLVDLIRIKFGESSHD